MASRWEQAIREKVQGFGGVLLQRTASPVHHRLWGAQDAGADAAAGGAGGAGHPAAGGRGPAAGGGGRPPRVRQALHLGTILVDEHAHEPPERFLAVGETAVGAGATARAHGARRDLVSAQLARLVAGWCELSRGRGYRQQGRLSGWRPTAWAELVLRRSP